ncbi:MAG TPA: AAA family ATPase [Caulobacteraceae bacterium]|jgi:hypothetical protein|nr:AAA family ATPase [Caulobacteraceae bacterium]
MNIDHGKTHWTEEQLDMLRSSVRELMSAYGLTQAAVSRESTVPAATLSQFLSVSYAGDNNAIAKRLSQWLNARLQEQQVNALAPPAPTFTQTKTADSVLSVLRAAQTLGDMGLVMGEPGVGKTAAALQYAKTNPRVAMATGAPAIASAAAILRVLLEAMKKTPRGRGYASKFELTTLARQVFEAGWLIVIDEAQHLQMEALEELRAIHDETGAGIVLIGNASVLSRIQGNQRNPAFAQLYSRIGVRVILPKTPPADVDAVLATMGIEQPEVLQVAYAIAGKDNLRQVVKAARRAQMVARQNREDLSREHLRLAYSRLGGVLPR